ncbi:hypothetical protein Anapl_05379 [Anas platyrhynchos]|uniref:Uncharacterized protein n=1 Tax=Anas platyrhynchos TaxID=8839 RepID=R0LP47_ANAPL|nr:hypothetical protein Anapl_05379 [Anas platyrhynchos]
MGVRNGEGNYPPKAAGHTKTICDEILFGSHLAKKRLGNQALFNISSTSCSRFQLSCEGSAGVLVQVLQLVTSQSKSSNEENEEPELHPEISWSTLRHLQRV